MGNLTVNLCHPPFLLEDDFPATGGYIDGRYCAKLSLTGYESCCLPCPQTDWVYADSFHHANTAANWVGVFGLICCLFILASYVALPVELTRRFYITTCVLVSIMIMTASFVIPLGAKPEQCYDAITPNDMHSNLACAWSGALLLLGGFCCIMWIFLCSVKLHLQICWKIALEQRFFIIAHAVGWGVPLFILTESLTLGGVSYRCSTTCLPNHRAALGGVWVPALLLAAATVLIQFATIGYCTKVYFECHMASYGSGSHLLSLGSSTGTMDSSHAWQAYNRVKGLVQMQWRGFVMVLIIISDVIFFCVCFLIMDNNSSPSAAETDRATPWLICLALHGGDKMPCLDLARSVVLKESTVDIVLILLAFNGIWALLLLTHKSMLQGWLDLFRRHSRRYFRDGRKSSLAGVGPELARDGRGFISLASPAAENVKSPGPSMLSIGRHSTVSFREPSYSMRARDTWTPISPGQGLPQMQILSPLRSHLIEKPLPPLPIEAEAEAWTRHHP